MSHDTLQMIVADMRELASHPDRSAMEECVWQFANRLDRLSTPAAGGDAAMTFTERHHEALRALADKFSSGNSVPVERATILRSEWDAICAFVRDQETIIDDRDDRLTALLDGIEGLEADLRARERFRNDIADDLKVLREKAKC